MYLYFTIGGAKVSKTLIKMIVLTCSALTLAGLMVYVFKSKPVTEEVVIKEKFFSESFSDKAQGITTDRQITLDSQSEKSQCAMEFSNDKTYIVECDLYLDFKIGEKVRIVYEGDHLYQINKRQ